MEWKENIKQQFAHTSVEAIVIYNAAHNGKLSLRKLALQSDLEYGQVQRITKAKVNVELSTVYSLAYGLDISPSLLLKPVLRPAKPVSK